MPSNSFRDVLNELQRGESFGVFIDDTGSPGLTTEPGTLLPQRKSWVAVVIPPKDIVEVLEQMPTALDELRRLTGCTEFHFADVYGGRKQYKNIDPAIRRALFCFMSYIFQTYKFAILVQTHDPATVASWRKRGAFPARVAHFDLKEPNDLALLVLIIRVKQFLEKQHSHPKPSAGVFVDEGWKKSGTIIRIPRFKDLFIDGAICFASSNVVCPIQLADFAAFAMNRTQLLLQKPILGDVDRDLIEILSPIARNYENIAHVPLSQWFAEKPTKH